MASDSQMEAFKTETITRLSNQNDINRTLSQCHPQILTSHQGQLEQEHAILQRRTEAGEAFCISETFQAGEWVKVNSNVDWLDL